MNEIVVNNWTLHQAEKTQEPLILDLDLAERLGFTVKISIRVLIRKLIKRGTLKGVFIAPIKTSEKGGRPGNAFYLTEKQALIVISHAETQIADLLLEEVIDLYLAYKRGQLTPPPQQIPTQDLSNLMGAVAALTIAVERLTSLQASQQQTAPQLQTKRQLQPSRQAPLQGSLLDRSRDLKWFDVADCARSLEISFERFWSLWRSAGLNNHYQRRQTRYGWQIREDAFRAIEVANDYR